ncbi:VOC family protein [Nostoc favosum]|uniref:VOC family protein n=1 Tax=Nostoc favosum CHAB5714 TaxID=2780399 RepID=A0ABS8IBY5_9NOSO|nr:VOC family protein [Nostoc favosum]MCC5601623.1 VOC family protein [Nostoc favosum CHAB5714]
MQTTSPQVSVDDFFLEVDHIFVCTTKDAESISVLQELGLHCSNQAVQHFKQGTASKIIFFENTYLELIWIEDKHLVEQQSVHTGVHTLSRLHGQHIRASPFGVGLRRKFNHGNLRSHSTLYWSEWMRCLRRATPTQMSISFAAENLVNQEEPFCFMIPDSIALTAWLDPSLTAHQKLISHPLGVKKLTSVKITINSDKHLTDAMSLLSTHSSVVIERGESPLLELTFDEGIREKNLDARPILPILLKY